MYVVVSTHSHTSYILDPPLFDLCTLCGEGHPEFVPPILLLFLLVDDVLLLLQDDQLRFQTLGRRISR